MNIDSIKNGYVIDHISAGQAMKIYEYLKLGDLDFCDWAGILL